MLTSYIRIAQRVSILTILVLLPLQLHAAPPVINYVSGAGPHPLGTTSVTIEILTDVVSNCRLNDVDDGNPGQWSTFLASNNNLNHTSDVTLSNDTDTARYIYCRNVSSGEVSSGYTFDITFVSSTNTPPTIDTTTSTTEVFEDSQFTYDVDATDAEDGTSLIYSLNSPPNDMTIDENSGLIQWTPDNDDVGNHAINIVVTDSGGLTDTEDFTLTVVNVNDAPLITSTDVTNANEGSSYSYDVEATDPDLNDSLTYTLPVKPDGMDIEPTTGLISWVPSSAQVGSHSVEIVVTDIEGATDQRVFTITVDEANVAPEIISTHVLNATENVAYVYDVDATDANNNDTLTYELDVNPPLMSIEPLTGVINWTPDNSDVGEHNVTVIVSDQSGLSDSESFVITVANVNGAPVFNSDPDLTAVEDELYSYDANATDDDAGDVITYSLDSPPAGMTIDPVSGVVEWTPNSSQIGDHNINIDATDLDGVVAAHDYVLTVSAAIVDVGPVRTYVSGAGPLSLGTTSTTMTISTDVVATCRYNNVDDNNPAGWTTNFSSSNGTDHTATVDLVNDENTTRYIICRDSSSGVVNQIAFVFNITFEVDSNQAPVIDSTEIDTATVDVEYIYNVEASDPDTGDTLTYDLTTSPPSMLIDQDTGVITWTPVTSDVGDHDVVVEVADEAGLTATQPYTLTVSNVVNQDPTITEITDVTVDEDNATDLIEFTVADAETADGDLTVTGSSDDLALVISDKVVVNQVSDGDWTVVVTPEDNVSGIAPIVITVDDGDGGLQTTTFNVTINAVNDEPTITTVADQTISEDGVTAALEFTVGDIETPAVDLEVTGTSSIVALVPNGNVEVIRVNDSGLWTVQVTPLPDQSGTTTITLTVTDGDLGEQASTFDLTVNGVNDSPTITDIADQTIDEDTATTELSFTVSDTETAVEDLVVSVTSENTALVEEAGLNLNNSGDGVWTLIVTPVDDANGEVDIVVSVTDGITPVDEVFNVTINAVNDAPTITSISDQTINEDTSTTPLEFTVADIDTDLSNLTIAASSPDEAIVRSEDIILEDNGSGLWTVVVSPIENVNGSVPITVSVSDGGPDIEESFTVTILSINDAPSITSTEITTATENTIYSYAVEAIDPDLDDTLTYSLETPPELMSIDPDSGLIEWTPTSSDVGQHSINIIVTDSDGLTDSQEFVLDVSASDSDNDGVIDSLDQCPETPSGETANADGCSPSQLDSDSDGVTDDIDQCANTPTDEVADANGCSPSQNQGPFVSSIIPQTGSDVVVSANDDASLQKGTQLNFTRNIADEIVVDNVNSLTWLDTASVATDFMDWNTATDYCESLQHAGIDNWRLPTKYELLFLLNYSHNLADGAPKIVNGFENTAASRYWTDFYELLNLSGGGTSEIATAVDFGSAQVSESRIQNRITSQKNVRCVSGDVKFEPEFSFRNVTHLKTVIYDSANKLMWQDTEEVTTDLHSWNDAINYCENLELDDSTDWRLPNIKEYFTLIDEDQFEPNYSNRDTFWTSTTIELNGGTQRAIRVTKDAENFATQSDSSITQSHYVRCVKDYSEPVAVSGGDRTVVVGELITFDGGQSFDPDGTIVAYQWVDPSSEVIYLDEVRYSTSYSRSEVYETSEFGIGTHEIGLSVEDNNRLKAIDVFTLTVVAQANIAPVANDQSVIVDEDSSVEITLDATDSNSDTLTYEIVDLPTNGDAVLVGVNSVTYTPAADFFGTDSFTFRANDGEFDSNLATITIDVASVNGGAPTANAGEDRTVLVGTTVVLDASASTDDEQIVSYEWAYDSNVVSNSSSFEVLDLSAGVHEYTLTVFDAEGLSGTDSVVITVNYPLDQCTITQSDSDYGFVDVFPDEDINWTGNSFSDVLEIETAFNHARQSDQSVFKFLSMPEQSEWDGFTLQQKALYLINSEREARGIKPFTGASPQVVTVAQNYADYLKDNNEVITHTRSSDGASPTDRLEEDPDILDNHEGTSENLYSAFFSIDDSEVLVDAIYRWMYMDKEPLSGSAWGHRSGLLKTGLQENNDSEFQEGLIGFGIATGDYDPLGVSVDGLGAVVVFNSIDQKSAWDNSNTETVDLSNAHLCNTDVPLVLNETQFETANLSSLTISPTYLSLNPGDSGEIKVNAYYSDGTSQDITEAASFIADTRSIVSVSAGVVTAETTGYATLFASVAGVESNRVTVVVGEETDIGNLTGTYGEQYLSYVPSNSTISHYDPKTFTLFNGTVLDRNNLPMAGVTISFHNSPQYGSVITDSLGQFIIAGEAGRRTIVYSREGYVTLQRTANSISNSWKTIENVILLEKDSKVTSIDLTSSVAQTHQSTIITDGFGSRATTLVFSGINQATITAQDGSTRILDEFLVRATEAEFPESMPAGLPEETEFTYCSELDIVGVGYEEAVDFDNPVVMYVDNFLGFPVGEIVPIGYFTGRSTNWEASDNGVVVKLLDSDSNGLVDGVDYTGDDIADDIDGDGSTTDEAAGIENYEPNSLYWRGSFNHFTWFDFNWGSATPAVERLHVLPEPKKEDKDDKDCVSTNSYVKPKPLALHEDIPVTGTNLTLHYSSQRTHGYHHKIAVNVSDETIPDGLNEIVAILEIGGNRFEQTFSAAALQDAEFIWDGTDPDGNIIHGLVTGKISVGHKLLSEYYSAGNAATSGQPLDSFANAWAQYGSETTGVSGREDQTIWSTSPVQIFNAPESQIANGWSLSNHHVAAGNELIHRGDGEAQEVKPMSLILKTGIVESQHDGDDGFYQKGGSHIDYQINEQGDLHDKVTGLTWEYLLNPVPRYDTYANAQAHCDSLNAGDEDENNTWRIPTSKEIAYSIDKSNGSHDFSLYSPDALNYWIEGRVDVEDTTYPLLCVKGEKLDDRYAADLVRNETDQVVIDQQNGLMWQDVAENATETYSWTGSLDYCEALDHAGYTDWRLPNVNEILYALPNSTFVNQTELDFSQGEWYPGVSFRQPYWTSTPDAVNEGVAWAVESLSYSAGYTQDDMYYARCVRDDLTRSRSPFIFDENGHHIRTIDLESGITLTTFEYDTNGRLISIQDRFENTITIERDEAGKATSIVSPDGYTTTLTVDSLNDLTRAEYDDGTGYDFVYENSLMTEETDPNRNLFVKTYDSTGRIEQTEDPEEGIWTFFNTKDEVEKIFTYGYGTSENNNYEVAISTLENGDTSLVTTHKDGSTSEEIRQLDKLKDTFTSSGVVTVIDKVVDVKTQLEIPQSITTTLPSGLSKSISVDKAYASNDTDTSQLTVTITEGLNASTVTENYETGERVLTSAEGRTSTLNFNPLTRQLDSRQVEGFEDVNYLYDSRGRLTSTTVGERVTTYEFDDSVSQGNLTSVTNALNQKTSFEYDAMGRVIKTTYHDSRVLEQSYDDNGNLVSITPPGQPAHLFNYNGVDKEGSYTPPAVDGVAEPATIYDYDKDRKLTKITRPDNQELSFNYKLNTDQIESMVIPTGSYIYGYDTNQELNSITAPSGEQLTFTLDGTVPTKTEWSGEIEGDVEVVLNERFLVAEQKVNGANSVSLSYDNDGLLTGIGSLTINRDALSGLISGSTLSNVTTSNSYNTYAEILNYNATYNSTELYNIDYTQDVLGRITKQVVTIDGTTQTLEYSYDVAGRLVQVKTDGVETESYVYDSNGNRTHINGVLTATYDEQDRLLTHGEFTYTYTENGELLSKTNTANNEVTSYVYDVIGNLLEVNLPDGTKVEYVVDGLNRRIGKKVNGVLVKGWLYGDQLNPVAEVDGNNNVIARFVYGDKINVPSYMEKGGQAYRIISDNLGSPRMIVNASTGVVEQRIDYDTWGNITNDTNEEFQPFGFAGGLYDNQTELTRFGARDYDANIGRWSSKDPIRFDDGLNIFGFVNSDPVNNIDPTGLSTITVGAGVGFGIGGPPGALVGAIIGLGITAVAYVGYKMFNEGADSESSSESAKPKSCPVAGSGSPDWDPGDDDEQQAKDSKRMSKKELDKAAKKNGYRDAHDLKRDFQLDSKSDIFVDKKGNLYSGPRKGTGIPQRLGININGT